MCIYKCQGRWDPTATIKRVTTLFSEKLLQESNNSVDIQICKYELYLNSYHTFKVNAQCSVMMQWGVVGYLTFILIVD